MEVDSDLRISLDLRRTKHVHTKYTITPSTEPYAQCGNFEHVTQTIEYKPPYDQDHIFTAYLNKNEKETLLRYRPMGAWNNVVQVETFYSYLHPDAPLVVGLKATAKSGQHAYYLCRELEEKFRGNTGLLPNSEVSAKNMLANLLEELSLLSGKQKLGLYRELSTEWLKQESILDGELVRVTHLPPPRQPEGAAKPSPKLSYDGLIGAAIVHKQNIYRMLHEQREFEFDGIIVYRNNLKLDPEAGDVPLLIELFSGCKREQLVRRDLDGTFWEKQQLKYRHEEELVALLRTIRAEADGRLSFLLHALRGYSRHIRFETRLVRPAEAALEFVVHRHTPSEQCKAKRARLCYRDAPLLVEPNPALGVAETLEHVQDAQFGAVAVYGLSRDYHQQLLLRLTSHPGQLQHYFYRTSRERNGWTQITHGLVGDREELAVVLNDSERTAQLLRHINYLLKLSVVVELDRRGGTRYPVRLIANTQDDLKSAVERPEHIKVRDFGFVEHREFQFVDQLLVDSDRIEDDALVEGLRFFVDSREVFFRNGEAARRQFVYFRPVGGVVFFLVLFSKASLRPVRLRYAGADYRLDYAADRSVSATRLLAEPNDVFAHFYAEIERFNDQELNRPDPLDFSPVATQKPQHPPTKDHQHPTTTDHKNSPAPDQNPRVEKLVANALPPPDNPHASAPQAPADLPAAGRGQEEPDCAGGVCAVTIPNDHAAGPSHTRRNLLIGVVVAGLLVAVPLGYKTYHYFDLGRYFSCVGPSRFRRYY